MQETGTTIDAEGVEWPTASVDVSDHPEVADLARVHAIDGIGDLTTTARRINGAEADLFLLGMRMTTPVTAAFALAFVLPEHLEFLEAAFRTGGLAIATTPPAEAIDGQVWLAISLDPTAGAPHLQN